MRTQSLVWTLCIMSAYMVLADFQRPFFIIGHMANSISEANSFLERGANALEIDIQFERQGRVKKVYHGWVCDCGRYCGDEENFTTYLTHIRDIASVDGAKFKGKMHFLMLDLKASAIDARYRLTAGEDLGMRIVKSIWKNVSRNNAMDVILSIPNPKYIAILRGATLAIEKQLGSGWLEHIGYAIDGFSDPMGIKKAFLRNGIKSHRWLGTGITNCLPYLTTSAETALIKCRYRFRNDCGFIDKAFHWTIDAVSSISSAIQIGYDAVITNYPENAIEAASMKNAQTIVRLAGPEDSPWTWVRRSVFVPPIIQ